MSEKNIVICDSELRYANNLMENIAERKELAAKVYACTSWENVKTFSEEKKINILIIDEGCLCKKREDVNAEQIFVLTTGNCDSSEEAEKKIYKYQCADSILTIVFESYFERTQEDMVRSVTKEHMRLFAVYSPIHRARRTNFAIAFGKELSKYKKVLYLNMEEYPGFGNLFEKTESGNLGDALYYTKQENGNFGIRLGMMVKSLDELDYIPPMPVCQDLKEVVWEEWEELLRQIIEHSIYEVVLLDISESIQGLFQILQLCDKVYMPILEDDISRGKLRQYEENIEKLQLDTVAERTKQLIIPQNVNEYVKQFVKEEKLC